jgi:hypothetical protein
MTTVTRPRALTAALLVAAAVSLLLLVLLLTAGQQPDFIPALAVPVLLCAVPLIVPARLRRRATWAAAVLLAIGVVLSLLSIGAFYLPAVVLLIVSAATASQPA